MEKREEFFYDSRDTATKIHAVKWIPDVEKPRAVLQIVHGMAEYILRYDEFARAMCKKGFLVVGSDHLGHGQSRREEEPFGYFCKRDAATVVIRDVHRLKKIIQEQNPCTPYFILGHSMGSFILRGYLARYGTGIDGAVIVGTGSQPTALAAGARLLAGLQSVFLGSRHKSRCMEHLAFGAYHKHFEPVKTEFDWLSRREDNVEAYLADPLCGFTFTLNGFQTLFRLAQNAGKQENIDAVPVSLPVLFLAGGEDPVGDYGTGVRRVYERFAAHGMQKLCLRLFAEDRHEVLNEEDRELVYEEVASFLEKNILSQ